MKKKKIIIFGATGNTGSYLTDYANNFFDKKEYEVIAVGKRETDLFEKKGIKYYSVDITKIEDFKILPKDNVYAIMLLAATIPSYMDDYDGRKYMKTNVMGAFNVLEYCRIVNADRIIYTQTVFDISLHAKDGVVLKPNLSRNFSFKGDHAVYVISKNTAVDLITHYHEEYGLKKFIFRLPTIYNYSSFKYYYPAGKKTMRPVYQMINKAINSEPIEVWGNKDYAKDMVHVNDFSQMLCRAVLVNREEGFYNVGTGTPVTIEEQVKTIIDVFSPKDNPSKIIYRPDKVCSGGYLMDITNASEELGYEAKYTCKDLFEDYKKEMELKKYDELRRNNNE